MSSDNEQRCDAKPLEWALFTLTIVSAHVTWWLFPLPTLFRFGFKSYIHDVSCECLRLHLPSYSAFTACFLQERRHWQMSYYSGVKRPPTLMDNAKALVTDSLIIVSTCLAIYRLCTGGEDEDLSGINSATWNYPSLPIAIYGLSIILASRTKIKLWIVTLTTFGVIVATAVTMGLVSGLASGQQVWVFSTVFFLEIALPWWYTWAPLIRFLTMIATFPRVGGPIAGAIGRDAYFPFCQLKGWGFGGPLVVLSIIATSLGIYGSTLSPRVEQPGVIEEMEEIP